MEDCPQQITVRSEGCSGVLGRVHRRCPQKGWFRVDQNVSVSVQTRRRSWPRGVRARRRLCDPALTEAIGAQGKRSTLRGGTRSERLGKNPYSPRLEIQLGGRPLSQRYLGASMGFQLGSKIVATPKGQEKRRRKQLELKSNDVTESCVPDLGSTRTAAQPTKADWNRHKRLSRFHLMPPRLTQKFAWQPVPKTLWIECDRDVADCTPLPAHLRVVCLCWKVTRASFCARRILWRAQFRFCDLTSALTFLHIAVSKNRGRTHQDSCHCGKNFVSARCKSLSFYSLCSS